MTDWDSLVLAPCERAFGECVTYLASDGPSRDLLGIFNDRFADVKYDDAQQVTTSHPMISVRAALLPRQPNQAELFRIRGQLYQVTSVEPDGMGDLRIHLRYASDDQTCRTPLPPI